MQITDKMLITMLILTPSNEQEIGYNSAVTGLLKKLVLDTVEENAFKTLRKALGVINISNDEREAIMNTVKADSLDAIIANLMNGNKLAAVKEFKEVSGLGLRDAKDVMDKYFEIKNLENN